MFFKPPRIAIAGWLALVVSQLAFAAETVHLTAAEFLEQSLPGCRQKALWLKKDVKAEIESMLERPYGGARIRYCTADGKTAWILDEIGKTEPITSGILVEQGVVEQVRVLIFRESRGGEVHREAFTSQYQRASLDEKGRLDQGVDGITGATMSVNAVNRQVRLALLLDGLVEENNNDR